MKSPLVSIVVPTYNRAALLDICLRHARSAPSECEILVVDNASTDSTPEVTARHAGEDPRVRVVRQPANVGMVPNFNFGMREARGRYLCLVCDDDLILPGHIEEKAAVLDRHEGISYVYCPWELIDGEGKTRAVPLGSGMLSYGYVGGRDEFGDLLQNNHIMMNSVLFRKSLLEERGYITEDPRYSPSNDWELWLRLSRGTQTAYLPEPKVCVRFHEASETAKTGNNHTRSASARLNIWRRYLLDDDPPVVLNENVWERMRALFDQDLNYWFGGDAALVSPYLRQFDELREANRRKASGRLRPAADQAVVRVPADAPASVHWHANVFDYSGYARLGRDAIRALDRCGASQSLDVVGGDDRFHTDLHADPEEARFWSRLQSHNRGSGPFICFGVPSLWNGADWYAHHRAAHPGHSRYIGLCMFETDRLPSGWAAACNGMDEVWVPSEFNRRTFADSGVDPLKVQVIPFGIDAAAYDPDIVTPYPLPEKAGFTFLSVFQWSERKGADVLLKAYCQAFTPKDDVCLVLRTYAANGAQPVREQLEASLRSMGRDLRTAPRIAVLDDFVPESEIPSLYRAADAFVLPTRGEGWGIPFMEAMASGLPVIATRWSAHLDFMTDDNSYLIDIEGLSRVANASDPFYTPEQHWAEPSVEHAATLMRRVFDLREESRARGAAARRHVAEYWTLERTGAWISSRVAESGESPPPGRRKQGGPPISWSSPLFDPSGYADEARHFVLALDAAGFDLDAKPVRWSNRPLALPSAVESRLNRVAARPWKPGSVHVSHIFPPSFTFREDACLNVGRTMFETDRLPDGWADACNGMDQVWIPSEFNRESFARAGVREEKLVVVPGAIDVSDYPLDGPSLSIDGARGFNFLSVFDWSMRKGWDLLITAYVDTFGPHDDVALIIKTHSSLGYTINQIGQQIVGFISGRLGRNMSAVPDIILQDADLPAHLMPALYRASQCFVLPTHGEGWGRPYMEAMAAGLPVIATGWGGNTAFMDDSVSYLLDSSLVPVPEAACAEAPAFRGHYWAEPDLDHLKRTLRAVFDNRNEARDIGTAARQHIASNFSYARVADIIRQVIDETVVPTLARVA